MVKFSLASGECLPLMPSLGMIPCQYRHIAMTDTSLKTRSFGLHFRCRKYWCIFNQFYVIRPKATKFGDNTLPLALLRRSRSSKVTEFGTDRKFICDFLLVINSNLRPILHLSELRRSLYSATPLVFNSPPPTEGFPWDDFRKILPGCQQMATVPTGVETQLKVSIA